MPDRTVKNTEREEGNGTSQQEEETDNLWLSLLKEAREAAQDTLERDATCWIVGECRFARRKTRRSSAFHLRGNWSNSNAGPPGSGKRSMIQALKQEARALYQDQKKSQKAGKSKDSTTSSKKHSETREGHQRQYSEEQAAEDEDSGRHHLGNTPFVCELSSPFYTYFQSDGSDRKLR